MSAAAHADELTVNSYARALFNTARTRGELSRQLEEVKVLAAILEQTVNLRVFLEGPQIPTEKKREMIDKAFKDRLGLLTVNLLYMMVDRGRARLLPEILREFQEVAERAEGIYPARVTSAHELGFEDKQRLKAALEKHTGFQLRVDYSVRPELIGGIVFRFRDVLIDSSIRHGLDALDKHFHRRDGQAA